MAKVQLLSRLNSLQRQGLEHGRAFWIWWLEQLLSLAGPEWHARLQGPGRSLVMEADPQHCVIRSNRMDGKRLQQLNLPLSEPLPALTPELNKRLKNCDEVTLILASEMLLNRQISLPAATENRLWQVLGYEMDRYTPFNAEQVYYDCRVTARDPQSQRINVELWLIPRAAIDPLLQGLQQLGLRPDTITTAALRHQLNLLPKAQKSERRSLKRRRRALRWLGAGLVAALVIWALFLQQSRQLEQLRQALVAPAEQAEEAHRLRSDIEMLTGSRTFLVERKQRQVAVLPLLDELTRLLPDHTWIGRFEWKGDGLRLQGESADASALIALLERSARLSDVRFASPVTKDIRTQKERFVILATLRVEATP